MAAFTYVPSYTTSGADKFKELRAEFGDGYVQIAPDGINPTQEVWNLYFDGLKKTQWEAIRTFFRNNVGKRFTWTNPNGETKNFLRKGEVNWQQVGPDNFTLNVTIEEAFG